MSETTRVADTGKEGASSPSFRRAESVQPSGAETPPWANPDVWSIGIAIVALLVALKSLSLASKANKVAATSAWAQEPIRLLAEETQSNALDAAAFLALLKSPIPNATKKAELLEQLRQQRDESAQRLGKLKSLVPASAFLIELKATRDSENDSFFSNQDIALPAARRDVLLAEFARAQQSYGEALRCFGLDLVDEELLEAKALPQKLQGKYLKS